MSYEPQPPRLTDYRTLFVMAILILVALNRLWWVMGWPPIMTMLRPPPTATIAPAAATQSQPDPDTQPTTNP